MIFSSKSVQTRAAAVFLAVLLIIPAAAFAADATADASDTTAIVSPALSVISRESVMTVTGMNGGSAVFTSESFDLYLGVEADSITILTVPDATDGTLYLGSVPVTSGQTVSRKNFSNLIFKAAGDAADCTFSFTHDGTYATTCRVRVIDSVNLAPAFDNDGASVTTLKEISVYGSVSAADPEGDSLTYVVTSSPAKGSVTITDASYGEFMYTPSAGKRGTDSFGVRAYDEYGNWSDEITVSVTINRNTSGITYTDLEGDMSYNAAIKMTSLGVMGGVYVNGDAYFYPDVTVSREDFVVMLMKTIGLSEIPEIDTVYFADDELISDDARNYVRAAAKLGFINGTKDEFGVSYFNPDEEITRAEAAVILQNVIGTETGDTVAVFSDRDSIPSWAEASVYAMYEIGVMSSYGGDFSPADALTRGQAAIILSNVADMVV
ncbi:MAG: S-layer homology domain-containing protein [Clostridia bacterium]|nr:S-layer homology domain-containing protein [Clostridia bacterium]